MANNSEDILAASNSASILSDEEDEEELSVKEVIERMQTAWINEKFAPCLLAPQTQLVQCLQDQIKQVEQSLAQVKPTDVRMHMHKMELSRIRFVLNAYLRCRLDKIDKNILDNNLANLSPEESHFHKSQKQNLEQHFKMLALQFMPGNLGKQVQYRNEVEDEAAVFVAALEDVKQVYLEEEDEYVDIEKGSQHILRFKSVKRLVQEGSIKLI